MKLLELFFHPPHEQSDEPLLVAMVRDKVAQGDRVDRRIRKGAFATTPEWFLSIERTIYFKETVWRVTAKSSSYNRSYLNWNYEKWSRYTLVPGSTPKTWHVKPISAMESST